MGGVGTDEYYGQYGNMGMGRRMRHGMGPIGMTGSGAGKRGMVPAGGDNRYGRRCCLGRGYSTA